MNKNIKILLLNLPSPPHLEICRDWAGGFGTAFPCRRTDYGQSRKTILLSFFPYASSVLSDAGYEFKVLDFQRLKLNQFQLLNSIKNESPDIIVSLIGLPSLEKDLELLGKIKQALQNVFIIGVGTTCRTIPREVLVTKSVDVVLRNSYPYISNLIDLVEALQRSSNLKRVHGVSYIKEKTLLSTPESPEIGLEREIEPSYDSLELEGYETFVDITGKQHPYIPILGSKGCPYGCIYCPYPIGFGRKWMPKSPKKIVDEMEYLYAVRNVKGFLLRDQSFMLNKKHATKVCDEIIRRKIDVAWFCEARVDEVNREILEKMKKAGCKRIHYGVETGDPEILKIAKPGVTLATIRKAFRLTKEIGLWTNAHVILGWPDDNEETIKKTCKFLLDLKPHSISWNVLTPYPGTKMYEIGQRDSLTLTLNWSDYTSHTIVMRTKKLSGSQLYTQSRRIIRDFSRQKLMKLLLQRDAHTLKQPKPFINATMSLIARVIFYAAESGSNYKGISISDYTPAIPVS